MLKYPGQPLLRLKQSHNPYNLLVNFVEKGMNCVVSGFFMVKSVSMICCFSVCSIIFSLMWLTFVLNRFLPALYFLFFLLQVARARHHNLAMLRSH